MFSVPIFNAGREAGRQRCCISYVPSLALKPIFVLFPLAESLPLSRPAHSLVCAGAESSSRCSRAEFLPLTNTTTGRPVAACPFKATVLCNAQVSPMLFSFSGPLLLKLPVDFIIMVTFIFFYLKLNFPGALALSYLLNCI